MRRCAPTRRFSTGASHGRSVVHVTRDHRNPHVCIATINRPTKLNALDQQTAEALEKEVVAMRSKTDVRALVITGEGQYFSAGGDLTFLLHRAKDTFANNVKTMLGFYSKFLSIRTLPFPVISALNGNAIGAGLCLATVTDIRIAAEDARFAYNFVRLGMGPGFGITHLLPKVVSPQIACHLLLTGTHITGVEAAAIGLVRSAVPRDRVLETSLTIAREIASSSAGSVKHMTELLRRPLEVGIEAALQKEAEAQAHCFASADFLEGITAIKEKRQPRF